MYVLDYRRLDIIFIFFVASIFQLVLSRHSYVELNSIFIFSFVLFFFQSRLRALLEYSGKTVMRLRQFHLKLFPVMRMNKQTHGHD